MKKFTITRYVRKVCLFTVVFKLAINYCDNTKRWFSSTIIGSQIVWDSSDDTFSEGWMGRGGPIFWPKGLPTLRHVTFLYEASWKNLILVFSNTRRLKMRTANAFTYSIDEIFWKMGYETVWTLFSPTTKLRVELQQWDHRLAIFVLNVIFVNTKKYLFYLISVYWFFGHLVYSSRFKRGLDTSFREERKIIRNTTVA